MMPQYFLHVRDGIDAVDREGSEFPDLAAARSEAIEGLRQILAQEVLTGTMFTDGVVNIADEFGGHLETVTCKAALMIVNTRPS
jgi:hypothetical protein